MSDPQQSSQENDTTFVEHTLEDDSNTVDIQQDADDSTVVSKIIVDTDVAKTIADPQFVREQNEDEDIRTFVENHGDDQTVIENNSVQITETIPDKTIATQASPGFSKTLKDKDFVLTPGKVDVTLGPGNNQPQNINTAGTITSNNQLKSGSNTKDLPASSADQTAELNLTRKKERKNAETGERTFGRFEIIKVLGEGAFGKVYLGKDTRLERELAIKVAKTGVLNVKEDVDRFQREARAAARLRHPNIVPVHEAGNFQESNYIAYDFVRGTTIKQMLKDRDLIPQRECVQLLVKIVDALHYAHEQGIVHRDIKPENIIVDEKHEPHVLDFGLARGTDLDVTHTREGAMMGSPAYMSPEQASGMSHLADERSDIWSLGVMMYEMLTGVRPFQGNITEVIIGVKTKDAPPMRSIVPNIDLDLVTICDKCLRKDPKERFATAGEMAEELHRWLRGEPIKSRPLNIWNKTLRWAKRNPTVAKLIGAVCVTLLVGTVTSSYFAYQAIKEKKLVIQTRKERDLAQIDNLVSGVPAIFPQALEVLKPYSQEASVILKKILADVKSTPTQKLRSRTALFTLLPGEKIDESEACHLICHEYQQLKPADILAVREYLTPALKDYTSHFWQEISNDNIEPGRRFTAGVFLAGLDQNKDRWEQIASDVVGQLLSKPAQEISDCNKLLYPVRETLRSPLELKFLTAETERERITAATVIAALYADQLEFITNLLVRGDSAQFPSIMEVLSTKNEEATALLKKKLEDPLEEGAGKIRIAELQRQKGNAACALVGLGRYELVAPYLKISADPRIRTHLVHELGISGISSDRVKEALLKEQDAEILASYLAMLSQYGTDNLLESDRRKLLPFLQEKYQQQLHPGVLGEIEYIMFKWNFAEQLALWKQAKKSEMAVTDKLSWFTNSQQSSFAVFAAGNKFMRGSPEDELGHAIGDIETQYEVLLPRSFAISTREITAAQFLKFKADFDYDKEFSPLPECPVHSVSWLDAARYCRWLSEQEQIPDDQMCYPAIDKITASMELPADFLSRTGYRLPTASEWEFACRGGSGLSRCYGQDEKLLTKYAWFNSNGDNHTHPVGTLLPNAYGLFDMHGNILEWTQNFYFDDLPVVNAEGYYVDELDRKLGSSREIRGGHFESPHLQVRSADREEDVEAMSSFYIGFRIARTLKK